MLVMPAHVVPELAHFALTTALHVPPGPEAPMVQTGA